VTALVFALLAALGNVAGGLVMVRHARRGLSVIESFVAFGAGFLLGVAFLDVLPEAYRAGGAGAFWYVFLGYLLVHVTQHTVTVHFHFGEETHSVSRAAGRSALVGLLLHTLFDGVAIASGFAVSRPLGTMLFFAILLHKLPEGVTITSLQLASGRRPGQAIGSAALLGVATVLGVVAHDAIGPLAVHGLALSAGVAIYVGASNLVPAFQDKRDLRTAVAFLAGAASSAGAQVLLGSGG
jgi:ZIP family zinc transporter/zinc and cadmium transporter